MPRAIMSYNLCDKIRDLKPYEPGTGDYRIRLDANESFVPVSESTMDGILRRIKNDALNRYPDPLASEACELFAAYYGVKGDNVTAGNGSDELLSVLTQSFLMRGQTMTVLSDDFSMYGFYGFLAEVNVDVVRNRPDGSIDVDGLIERVNSTGSRLLLFSNPCNPTGLGISAQEALRIVDSCPDCLVIVDEAYMDFWDQALIRVAPERENMIVLKTCSKALRLAGIRCGFAVAGEKITKALRAVKSPYNVSRLTQIFAAEIFAHPEELDEAVAAVLAQRDSLRIRLLELKNAHPGLFEMNETATNFFMLRFESGKAAEIFQQLKQKSILVRHFGGGKLRITVGSEAENNELMSALEQIIQ